MSDDMSYALDLTSVYKFIGSIDDIQNIDKGKEYSVGDVIYSKVDQGTYLYTGNKFERLESCNDTNSSTLKMKPHPTNCVNCGAVLTDYKCKYCGTEHPRY